MSAPSFTALLIEDSAGDAGLIREHLAELGAAAPALEWAQRLAAGLERLARGGIDAVLLDLSLPDSHGLDTFRRVQAQAPRLPVVVLSGLSDEAVALQAVQEGAQDYLVKGQADSRLLGRALRYAIQRKQAEEALQRSNDQLRQLAAATRALADAERDARLEAQSAYEELKKAQGTLVQSERLAAIGQLATGVAHEINNPLALVLNDLAVLERDAGALHRLVGLYQQADALLAEQRPELHRDIQALAEEIDLTYTLEALGRRTARSRDGLRRIQQIVLALRDFARPETAGELRPHVDVNAGLRATAELVRGRARGSRVELELDLAPLPLITCQPSRVNQVFLSLIDNALYACDGGGTVTVASRLAEGGVAVEVADTGPGIAPEVREHIFDPFFTTKPVGQGTGLGLSISHGIVAEHGGRIEVASAPGEGARFTVFLPRQPP
jgi:signal transduction histidine kinase